MLVLLSIWIITGYGGQVRPQYQYSASQYPQYQVKYSRNGAPYLHYYGSDQQLAYDRRRSSEGGSWGNSLGGSLTGSLGGHGGVYSSALPVNNRSPYSYSPLGVQVKAITLVE